MALDKGKQTGKCSYSRNILTRLELDLEESGNVVLNVSFLDQRKNGWTWTRKQPNFNLIYPEQGAVR